MPIFNLDNQDERNEYAKSDAEKTAYMTYNIKISGEGTAQQIAQALRDIADAITAASDGVNEVAELDGAEWEGSVLMTEISHI